MSTTHDPIRHHYRRTLAPSDSSFLLGVLVGAMEQGSWPLIPDVANLTEAIHGSLLSRGIGTLQMLALRNDAH